MARAFVYTRSIDTIFMDIKINGRTYSSKHGIKGESQICHDVSPVNVNKKNQTIDDSLTDNCPNQKSVSPEESASLIKNNSNQNISNNKQNKSGFNKENDKHKLAGGSKLTCDVCFLTFEKEATLEVHKKNYASVFKCHKCSIAFHRQCSLTFHIRHDCRNYGRKKKFKCNFCNRSFCYNKQLQAHLFHGHNDEIFSTERKNVTIPVVSLMRSDYSGNMLAESNKNLSQQKTFQCYICKKSFFLKENRREHVRLFHSIYMSSICNARYTTMKKLLSHYIRQHIVFKLKKCCVCYENFNSLALLKRHIILHCVKTVRSSKDTLPVNVEINCNVFKKRHKCKGCHKRFWLKSCLEQHGKVCGRLKCIIRDKQDTSRVELNSSPEKSSNEKIGRVETPELENMLTALNGAATSKNSASSMPVSESDNYLCSIQTRMFNGIARVKGYEIANVEKTKFPCTICGIQFQIFQNLCIHERTYCQPATNKCNYCSTAFSTKRLLQRHVLATHTPSYKKDFMLFCKFCNQGFRSKKNLRMHVGHFHNKQDVIPALNHNSEDKPICNMSLALRLIRTLY